MHKCIKCAKVFEDDQVPLFAGCGCGSKFFVSVKPGQENEVENLIGATDAELDALKSRTDLEILKVDQTSPVPTAAAPQASGSKKATPQKATSPKATPQKISTPESAITNGMFGVETVRMSKPGVYDINIEALLRGRPVVIFSNGRTYIIHLATAFKEVVHNAIG